MKNWFSMIFSGVVGGLLVLGSVHYAGLNQPTPLAIQATTPTVAKTVDYRGNAAPVDLTRAAHRAMPAVVHIKASESRTAANSRRSTDPFSLLFGEGFGFNQQPRSGTGSGVIYTNDGYILTNNHVVEFADEFEVTMYDERKYKARLVGRDDNTDMAVIKIDGSDFPTLDIADSDDTQVGEWVLAVGNPFDLTSTVTAGIISAKSRDIGIIKSKRSIESFIQTDAAVNPGNSGGALVDLDGKLIGINSAIATPTGTFAGYSFAIPSNLAKRIADDLIKYGQFRRVFLGVEIAAMDQSLADEMNMDYVQGVAVLGLDERGSAAYAGIQKNDIIVQVNGREAVTIPELQEMISRSRIGETLDITLLRAGKKIHVPVKLRSKASE